MSAGFTYRGISSEDFGLIVESKENLSMSAFEVEKADVPGRDGDLILPGGRIGNVTVSYTVFFKGKNRAEMEHVAERVRAWLLSGAGSGRYFRLTDSYDPSCFRLAIFASKLNFTEVIRRVGKATITFSCLPYRYRNSGERAVSISSSGDILYNPESIAAYPYIKVTGTGNGSLSLTYANVCKTWILTDISEYIEIDSQEMECYKGSTSMNTAVSGESSFPVLEPGKTVVSFAGDVTAVDITPRWRFL